METSMNLMEKFLLKARRDGNLAAARASVAFIFRKLDMPIGLRPFEYIQRDIQHHLHKYLGVAREEVLNIVTVGAHLGFEVVDMLRQFPEAQFILFESSPRYAGALKKRFSQERRVRIFECAVADIDGVLKFFETSLDGSGSILKVGDLAQSTYGMEQREEYTVDACRLDSHARAHGYQDVETDCLWIDVQGAELQVLQGAAETLKRTKSVFVEVSIFEPLYVGGTVLSDISNFLEHFGFVISGLGVDSSNGTGNAFFARKPESG
jgi:FkbM family methyltransferase